jgi:hypothetical protein
VYNRPRSGIIRLVDFRGNDHATVCLSVLEQYGEEIQMEAIITLEHVRLRVSPTSIKSPENVNVMSFRWKTESRKETGS